MSALPASFAFRMFIAMPSPRAVTNATTRLRNAATAAAPNAAM